MKPNENNPVHPLSKSHLTPSPQVSERLSEVVEKKSLELKKADVSADDAQGQNCRPVLFSGPMVRAILENRKTQTRRVLKPQPEPMGHDQFITAWAMSNDPEVALYTDDPDLPLCCPYGVVGDRLWVRETHAWADELVEGVERGDPVIVAYRADSRIICHEGNNVHDVSDPSWNLEHPSIKWRPSIHMPRWASRITLEITKIRVERLQDISEEDAREEGAALEIHKSTRHAPQNWLQFGDKLGGITAKSAYEILWNSINGNGAWELNPWVWVIEFCRVGNDGLEATGVLSKTSPAPSEHTAHGGREAESRDETPVASKAGDAQTQTARTGKTFQIRTLRDLYELPTIDMMERALQELGEAMSATRRLDSIIVETATELAKADGKDVSDFPKQAATWPETCEWTDDEGVPSEGKFVNEDGSEFITIAVDHSSVERGDENHLVAPVPETSSPASPAPAVQVEQRKSLE